MAGGQLRPAALAFDGIAPTFDARFGAWQSVEAQRRAVRCALAAALPPRSRVLELGGGTGEDALWLAGRGRHVTLTDASPAMAGLADAKLRPLGSRAEVAAAEELESFAHQYLARGGEKFDGAFSNFAPLNCVEDLSPVGRGLAQLIRPGGSVLLVLFGTFCPGEMLVESMRGRPRQALRRFRRSVVPARLGGRSFGVTYHRARTIHKAMRPWFEKVQNRGIGIFVPPSAAEPWISRHPRLLATLESLDRIAARPLAHLGDHVLYYFRRTGEPEP